MVDFKNFKELEKYLQKQIKKSLEEDVAEAAKEQTKESIDRVVYDDYEPTEYQRSYELKDSVSSHVLEDKDKSLLLEIYHDVSLINPYIVDGTWNIHADVWGNDQSQNIVEWTLRGHGGLFTMPPRDYISDTIKVLKENKIIIKQLKDSFKKKGIDVE